jgi:uncharacterized protein with HEPN domain
VSRDWRLYLDDIVEYAERALRYTEGLTYEQFLADTRTYDATLRCLEIVGEAVKKLPIHVRELAPGVPWRQIAGFRDRLAHGYSDLDDEIVWSVVQQQLVPLRNEADRLRGDP